MLALVSGTGATAAESETAVLTDAFLSVQAKIKNVKCKIKKRELFKLKIKNVKLKFVAAFKIQN